MAKKGEDILLTPTFFIVAVVSLFLRGGFFSYLSIPLQHLMLCTTHIGNVHITERKCICLHCSGSSQDCHYKVHIVMPVCQDAVAIFIFLTTQMLRFIYFSLFPPPPILSAKGSTSESCYDGTTTEQLDARCIKYGFINGRRFSTRGRAPRERTIF